VHVTGRNDALDAKDTKLKDVMKDCSQGCVSQDAKKAIKRVLGEFKKECEDLKSRNLLVKTWAIPSSVWNSLLLPVGRTDRCLVVEQASFLEDQHRTLTSRGPPAKTVHSA
jgi:hypothetical protein